MDIKTVKNEKDIDKLVKFFEEVFSEFTIIDEHSLLAKKEMMMSQFKEKPEYIIYIEDKNKVLAALFSFYSKPTNQLIVGVIGVDKENRYKGLGSKLLDEISKRAKKNKINSIYLTSKTINYDFYIKNGYKPVLNYVVFDYISKEDLERFNRYGFELYDYYIYEYKMDGKDKKSTRVKYIVPYPKEEYLTYYNRLYDNSSASYSFVKEL